MAEKKNIMTHEGLLALEEELHNLKVVRRKEVAGKIKEAREQGDLSENAEYDAAKEEQAGIEARIEEIERILKNAEVFDEDESTAGTINIGWTVTIKDLEDGEELEYKIVGSTESNSLMGKISNESPVGKALIGHKAGDVISVETQAGVFKYEIIEGKKTNNFECFRIVGIAKQWSNPGYISWSKEYLLAPTSYYICTERKYRSGRAEQRTGRTGY